MGYYLTCGAVFQIPIEEKRSWYFKMATIYIRYRVIRFRLLSPHSVKIFKLFSVCRLDNIVKTKEDSEYSRLSHYNKGLQFLKETLESEKTQYKGKHVTVLYQN